MRRRKKKKLVTEYYAVYSVRLPDTISQVLNKSFSFRVDREKEEEEDGGQRTDGGPRILKVKEDESHAFF